VLPPAYGAANRIENATAAPGAMLVTDMNRKDIRPTASRCSPGWSDLAINVPIRKTGRETFRV